MNGMNDEDIAQLNENSDLLHQRREHEIDAQYERAYAGVEDPFGKDFEGWEEQGVWPPE
jgi:hypothetical protein